jgi:two-component system sensor histidine kinase KdpD
LLRRFREEEARQKRGKLKIFLGASPGVGKTFSMLEAARTKRAEGVDVVAGVVETHGRVETAQLLQGLEVIPKRPIEYRGTRLEEFDLDAALARHPTLLLLDEAAHTNAPGSRHDKRWQDIDELLAAGISVYTTLNIQHIESLNDVVAQITSVKVRETVPDNLLERADEVELVDVTADVLLQRLREGKVYLPEQASRAIDRFFRKGNLIALRELALRRTAERVDAQMRGYMAEQGIRETWAAAERLLVCVGPSPTAVQLVRATRRMAARLHADWIAVHVETSRDQRLTPTEREYILRALELAEQLGGRTVTLSGQSVTDEILAYARDHNVNRIVVGKTKGLGWRERLGGSLLDALVRRSGAIEVLAITGEGEADQSRPPPPAGPVSWREYAGAVVIVWIPTALGMLLRSLGASVPTIDAAMLYLLAVVVAAARYRQGPAVTAALVGIASFDFFFVHPFYTFSVSDVRYLLTFVVMLLVALVLGRLTGRIRDQAEAAREREQRTAALYALSRELASARTREEVLGAAIRSVQDTFAVKTAVFLPGPDGRVERASPAPYPFDERERAVAQWSQDHGQVAGQGTKTLPAAAAMYLPLSTSDRVLGVLGIDVPDPGFFREPARRRLLETLSGQTAAALERLDLTERSRQTAVEFEAERLRNALLSSLSHDMRAPLASIEQAANALLQGPHQPARQHALVAAILQDSQQMGRLVANLLDMMRVESGALQVQKEWQQLSDVVGVALLRVEEQMRKHPVTTNLPADLPLVPVDEILLEQVFVNLLENAAQHTPEGTPVEIGAEARPDEVMVWVADRGPGLPQGEEERVFEKFHRATPAPGAGVGLGLAICRGIIAAHGGRIWAESRPGGGAVIRFTVPVAGTPPEVTAETAAAILRSE